MKKLLLITICLLAAGVTLSAQKTMYIIDNETVEHFDGSQLKGKIISDYKISTSGTGRNAITVHAITTTGYDFSQHRFFQVPQTFQLGDSLRIPEFQHKADTIFLTPNSKVFQRIDRKVVYVIDGVISEDGDVFKSLSSQDIASITVLNESSAAKKYGVNASVILIQTKKGNKNLSEILKDIAGVKVEADGSITVNGEPVKSIKYKGRTYYAL